MCDDPSPRSLRRGCPRSPHRTYFQPDLHIEEKNRVINVLRSYGHCLMYLSCYAGSCFTCVLKPYVLKLLYF